MRDAGLVDAGRPGVVTYSRKVFVPLTRLCRDRCHYCTFATVPGRLPAPFLSLDEVVELARQGAALGCKEALFTLGDRPEDRWEAARDWLDEAGYDSTLAYVRACAIAVLEQTGLLPHLNPGVMTWGELQRLKPVAPSLGMMLETTADVPAHHGSPDKDPAVRLRVLEDAGRHAVPFTTGLLVGIGETLRDRAETVFAIRASHRRHGHVQEVIVQNFRAKDDTAMRAAPDADDGGVPRRDRRHPAGDGPAHARAGAAEPGRPGRDGAAAARRRRRLGRRQPAHARPRQPRAAVAAGRGARAGDGRERLRAARAADRSPALPGRALARPAAVGPRGGPRRPRRAGPRGRASGRTAVAGAGRRARAVRPHRPARERRHRRALGRAAQRLRRRLRRLGGRARQRPGDRAAGPARQRRRCGAARGPRPAGRADRPPRPSRS